MSATEALYNLSTTTSDYPRTAYAVERHHGGQWEMMACKWATLDEAMAHARRIVGCDCRIVRITVEAVMGAFENKQ